MSDIYSKKMKELEQRISKLEKVVFDIKEPKIKKTIKYEGLVGGIKLLVDKGFFKKPVMVTEVQDALQKEGYFRPIQSTDATLRKEMAQRKKILTRVKLNGVWHYVIKK